MPYRLDDDSGTFEWRLDVSDVWEPFMLKTDKAFPLQLYIEKNYLNLHDFALSCGVSEEQVLDWIEAGIMVFQHRLYKPMFDDI